MRLKNFVSSLSVLAILSGVSWGTQEFKIEPGWSHVEFSVKNFGLHNVDGRFQSFSGTIFSMRPTSPGRPSRFQFKSRAWTRALKSATRICKLPIFLTRARFRPWIFTANESRKKATAMSWLGMLSMKGHTKEVELPFTYSLVKSEQGTPTLRAEAKGAIDRHDFGINYGSNFSVASLVQHPHSYPGRSLIARYYAKRSFCFTALQGLRRHACRG